VLAAASLGRRLGLEQLITIDMGGTSLDIGVVENARPLHKYEGKIGGFPVRMPAIDVAAVAAGGGSLALVDDIGYIQVDRESAGSQPGPACYDRGGTRPTITDADVVLGRLGAGLGGRGGFTLKPQLAVDAFEHTICRTLGVDVTTAATSALDIIQARMVKAIASNPLEKGLDIRRLPLLVYGGAGPTHGVELADAMGMTRVLVPYLAGNFSAIGLLLCPLRCDEARMLMQPAGMVPAAALAGIISELDVSARTRLAAGGAADAELTTHWLAHMRYAGQSYDLAVTLDELWYGSLSEDVVERLVETFHQLHQRHYAYSSLSEVVELVQLRVSVSGSGLNFPQPQLPAASQPRRRGERQVYFTGPRQRLNAVIWDRTTLPPGFVVAGPAVIEGEGSSALLPPDWRLTVDDWLNLDIRRRG
jgi:N-methylhydantoinase A